MGQVVIFCLFVEIGANNVEQMQKERELILGPNQSNQTFLNWFGLV